RRRHTRSTRDWSSDVCSSDLSRGEPLACPLIKEMLSYLRGKFLALKMNTNASLLDEVKCHAILASEMNTLVFSADAAAEPAYSRSEERRVGKECEDRSRGYGG